MLPTEHEYMSNIDRGRTLTAERKKQMANIVFEEEKAPHYKPRKERDGSGGKYGNCLFSLKHS